MRKSLHLLQNKNIIFCREKEKLEVPLPDKFFIAILEGKISETKQFFIFS
jgi:hypothetical protein